jgi:hypothetical protein
MRDQVSNLSKNLKGVGLNLMGDAMEKITTIAVAIVGVATLAVLVSKRADTSNVIKSAGTGI